MGSDAWLSRQLPDAEIALRDARDFIFGSPLARKAFEGTQSTLPLFVHDLLDGVYRLVQSCHLPEFTDHGIPHLCSLVDRVSRWESPPDDDMRPQPIVEGLTPDESGVLLLSVLIHDIGMLSQNPTDLPVVGSERLNRSMWPDTATWVRATHVDRLDKLTRRVLASYGHTSLLSTDFFSLAVEVAKAHHKWPWEWSGVWCQSPRNRGLAAIVAVADLLDEDSARCDTTTLLEHRVGNELNRAHWLRHALTTNRIQVECGRIQVNMACPPETSTVMKPVYSAVRNHFRLVNLYEEALRAVNAEITNLELSPSTGVPNCDAPGLEGWRKIRGFANEQALCFQLLRTFMAPVLKDERKCDNATNEAIRKASLEDVDLRILEACEGTLEPRPENEQTFAAIALGRKSS